MSKSSEPRRHLSSSEEDLEPHFQHYCSAGDVSRYSSHSRLQLEEVRNSRISQRAEPLGAMQSSNNAKSFVSSLSASMPAVKIGKFKNKSLSMSVPTSPKVNQNLSKSNTLPHSTTAVDTATKESTSTSASSKKSRSATLASFFKRWSPKLKRGCSAKGQDKPWVVVEFSQSDLDGSASDAASVGSDRSFELALQNQVKWPSEPCTHKSSTQKSMFTNRSSNQPKSPSSRNSLKRLFESKHISAVSKVLKAEKTQSEEHLIRSSARTSPDYGLLCGDSLQKGAATSPSGRESSNGSRQQEVQDDSPLLEASHILKPPQVLLSQPQDSPLSSPGGRNSPLVGDGQLRADLQPSPPRLRIHQPPRTLNILNKIVVRSPHMEQIATKMTSAESIGSCSLDVDATASESSGATDGHDSSVSQRTLHSASIVDRTSSLVSAAVKSPTGSRPCRTLDEPYTAPLSNGRVGGVGGDAEGTEPDLDVSPRRQPSYVGISCSVSGYSSFSRYNSKPREGLRSRDASPARATFPTLPDLVGESRSASQDVDAMGGKYYTERPPNLTNGHHHVVNGFGTPDSRRTLEISEKRMDSWSSSVQNHSNGDTVVEAKSLVQQRIERLYGPGALAQGFLVHRVKARTAHSVEKLPHVKTESVTTCSSSTTSISCRSYVSTINAKIIPIRAKKFYIAASPTKTIPDQSLPVSSESSLKEPFVKLQYQDIQDQSLDEKLYVNGHQDEDVPDVSDQVDLVRSPPSNLSNIGNNFEPLVSNGCINESKFGASSEIKNGEYFIKVMEVEQRKIEELIAEGEEQLRTAGFSEDLSGRFRATIGKASLLLTQKFQQFRGLCEKNICQHPDDPFPTTTSDLAGFWDMVLIQVHNIYDMFRDIDLLKDSQWHQRQVTESDGGERKIVKTVNGTKSRRLGAAKKSTPVTSAAKSNKSEEATRAREEARKRLAEMKRKARSQLLNANSEEQVVKIFAPDSKE